MNDIKPTQPTPPSPRQGCCAAYIARIRQDYEEQITTLSAELENTKADWANNPLTHKLIDCHDDFEHARAEAAEAALDRLEARETELDAAADQGNGMRRLRRLRRYQIADACRIEAIVWLYQKTLRYVSETGVQISAPSRKGRPNEN